jgi:hypothetical protein
MSYTKITIEGQEVGLKFGYDAVKEFLIDCEKNQEEYFDNNQNLTVFGVAALVYWAYRNNQLVKQEDVIIQMESFEDWVIEKAATDEGMAELANISKLYEESRYVKLFVRQANKVTEEIKKKTLENTSKKSKRSSLAKV